MSRHWAFMERFEIPDYDQPAHNYLTRWRLIQTPWFGVYLHRLDGPDPRSTLHDHPWDFVSIVLRGGYWEMLRYEGPHQARFRPVRFINRKRANDLHTIVDLERRPTWTLMLVGRRQRTWGYRDPDGTWTAFDRHPHAREFEQALEDRRKLRAEQALRPRSLRDG